MEEIKLLGSLLDTVENIKRRMSLATSSAIKLESLQQFCKALGWLPIIPILTILMYCSRF